VNSRRKGLVGSCFLQRDAFRWTIGACGALDRRLGHNFRTPDRLIGAHAELAKGVLDLEQCVNEAILYAEPSKDGQSGVVLDDCLVIDGLKIIERDQGLFVSMPSRKRQDGTFADTVHPTNAQTREMIEHSVLTEYERVVGKP
jgi:DNA-binding cell septation regulator SpoVG